MMMYFVNFFPCSMKHFTDQIKYINQPPNATLTSNANKNKNYNIRKLSDAITSRCYREMQSARLFHKGNDEHKQYYLVLREITISAMRIALYVKQSTENIVFHIIYPTENISQ